MTIRFDSGFWANDTIAGLNRLNVRYTMAVRCSSKGINDAIAAIPADAWTPKGFEGFELRQPSDERTRWLAVTRWQDDTHSKFEARRSSPSFDHGHRGEGGDSRPPMSIPAELSSYIVAVTSKG